MKTVIDNGNGTQTVVALQDGALITGSVSHVSHDIAEHAKGLHKAGMHGSGEMRHAAKVDPVVIEAWCNARGVSWAEFSRSQELKRSFLNDPANADFRIWKGRV